jgi:hypothetical protein
VTDSEKTKRALAMVDGGDSRSVERARREVCSTIQAAILERVLLLAGRYEVLDGRTPLWMTLLMQTSRKARLVGSSRCQIDGEQPCGKQLRSQRC